MEEEEQSQLVNESIHTFLPLVTLSQVIIPPLSPPTDPLQIQFQAQLNSNQQTLPSSLNPKIGLDLIQSLLKLKFSPLFAPLPTRSLPKRLRPLSQQVCMLFNSNHQDPTAKKTLWPSSLPQRIHSKWFTFKMSFHSLDTQNLSSSSKKQSSFRSSDTSSYKLCIQLQIRGGFLLPKEYPRFKQDLLQVDRVFKPLSTWIERSFFTQLIPQSP